MKRRIKFLKVVLFTVVTFLTTLALLGGCKSKKSRINMDHISAAEIKIMSLKPRKVIKKVRIEKSNTRDISALRTLLSSTKSPLYKCGYSGEVKIFFWVKTKQPFSLSYSLRKGCMHGVYTHKNKLHSYKLSSVGIGFLRKLHAKYEPK